MIPTWVLFMILVALVGLFIGMLVWLLADSNFISQLMRKRQ